MSKRALVTGCAGFIGSHLSEFLLNTGWEVIGIDCFINNYERSMKERNLYSLISCPRFVFIRGDLMQVPLEFYLRDIDTVFHQASLPGVRNSWGEQFDAYVTNNILVTQRLLEIIKDYDINKFIYASSSSVYGNTSTLPMREIHLPKPFSPYGVTKMAAENLCNLYYENYGVPVVLLRYFTVYGPRQRPDMAIYKFINAISTGKPIKIYGDGSQKRDFTYIGDIVQANILAADSSVAGEVLNVGSGCPTRLMDLIRILERITGEKAQLEFVCDQKGDVRDTFADISKINQMLGFKPSYGLEQGLINQVKHMCR